TRFLNLPCGRAIIPPAFARNGAALPMPGDKPMSASDQSNRRAGSQPEFAEASAGPVHGGGAEPQSEARPRPIPQHVDDVWKRFDDAWKAGQQPRIEDYLRTTPEPE